MDIFKNQHLNPKEKNTNSKSSFPHVFICFPWLSRHNPHIDWVKGKIISWSPFCHSTCLQSALPPTEGTVAPSKPKPPDLAWMAEYHDLGEIFSKDLALSLPPHRPSDCAIDLLPGAPLPTSRLYSLSCLWKRGHGKIHYRFPGCRYHSAFLLPCGCGVFLCIQKRSFSTPLYWFQGFKQHHCQEQISSATNQLCFWTLSWSHRVHQTGSQEQGGRRMENCLQHPAGTLWVFGNAFWAH